MVAVVSIFTNLAIGVGIGVAFSALMFAWDYGKEITVTDTGRDKAKQWTDLCARRRGKPFNLRFQFALSPPFSLAQTAPFGVPGPVPSRRPPASSA